MTNSLVNLVKDINATSFGSNPRDMVGSAGSYLLLAMAWWWWALAINPLEGTVEQLDVLAQAVLLLMNLLMSMEFFILELLVRFGTLLYRIINGNAQPERIELTSGETGCSPSDLTNVNSTLYFVASSGGSGVELWQLVEGQALLLLIFALAVVPLTLINF